MALEQRFGAHNYEPLPVVVAHGQGAWVWDVDGKRYLDFLAAYSAINFGHCHPTLVGVAHDQLEHLTLTSRAVYTDQLGAFERDLAHLTGKDMVLTMNTGAEGVESAIKVARKWGYEVKGVGADSAKIVVCDNNFHGRTTTIVGFSSDPRARTGFGPFSPGFMHVPFADAEALEKALGDPDVVAFLFEPIQGEAGVILPPDGYLGAVRNLCSRHNVLMIADEIQTGLGRTGYTFGCDHENVKPDVYVLGKALGGGIVPLSAVAADRDVLGVLTPGTHGSTFGGNPLACAIGRAVLDIVRTGEYQERSRRLGETMLHTLRNAPLPSITEVRGRGLWAGIELAPAAGPASKHCERLLERGIIVRDTHATTLRLAPPLVIEEEDLEWALQQILEVLA
ncbi:MAG: ornithine--oxo-acid transaminase [Coriobacteriia bacterium]|nr:ornithine--oxo-acid transaminase [Coriobacteriia bacterium]